MNNKSVNNFIENNLNLSFLLINLYPKFYNRIDFVVETLNKIIFRINMGQDSDNENQFINYNKMIIVLLIIIFKYHYNDIYKSNFKEKELLRKTYNEIINNREVFEEETVTLFEFLFSDTKVKFNPLILSLLDHVKLKNVSIIITLICQMWYEDFRMKYSISGREFTFLDLIECENRHFTVNGIILNEKEKIEYAKRVCVNLCWIESASLEDLQKSQILSSKLNNAMVLEDVVKLTAELCLLHDDFVPFVYQTYKLVVKDLY